MKEKEKSPALKTPIENLLPEQAKKILALIKKAMKKIKEVSQNEKH